MVRIASIIALIVLCTSLPAHSQNIQDLIPAQRPDDTLATDTAGLLPDSLGLSDSTQTGKAAPPQPPVRLMDSLTAYFARHSFDFDASRNDLYPRDAAGFLYHEASFYTITYHETPLRTTVSPYGLPGGGITVQSDISEAAPYDRTIPADGLTDFSDISTGNVATASLIEGPLSGYNSLSGGMAMLFLKPFEIPSDQAVSRLTVERGAYGYAYTRGRVARMFTPDLGFSFSTDYRKGDAIISNGDDDGYNIKFRLFRRFDPRTTLDAGLGVYRRTGGFSYYRRLRRDQQWTVRITRQEVFGGQVTGMYNLDLSRSADPTKTIRPRNTYTELSYLLPRDEGLYQVTVRFGKEQYYINRYYSRRFYGFGGISGFINLAGGQVFFFGRMRDAENQNIAYESAAGYNRKLSDRFRLIVSGGLLEGWPDLTDLYMEDKNWGSGLIETANIDLKAEKKLTGNAALFWTTEKYELSASINAGRADDLIYYDRNFDQYPTIRIIPSNDNVSFADLNLSGSFHDLWWFYGNASGTIRGVDSDRYGSRIPYSPRWQIYGQLGLYYHVTQFDVNVRLFGDMTYTERPLSYLMQELQTTAVFNWGINATLKDLTVYYMMHNASNQYHRQPEEYGYTGWFYSWGFNWKFWD